jgi:hypothetical protein
MSPLRLQLACGVVVAAAIATSGCAAQINSAMSTWVGHHQSELIRSWGPPSRTASDGQGGTVLIYDSYVDMGQTPGTAYTDPYGNVRYTTPQQNGYARTRMFYVNADGYIYSWRWQGY